MLQGEKKGLNVHNLKINYGYKLYNPIDYNAVNKTNVSKNVTVWENVHSITLKIKKDKIKIYVHVHTCRESSATSNSWLLENQKNQTEH